VHTRSIPLSEDVDIPHLARGTPGFSGAQLASLTNEAALLAAIQQSDAVTMANLNEARDRILMGKARNSLVISEKDRRNRAYCEAGHALLSCLLPEADPLHKVTIIPRGRALGRTVQFPREDLHHQTKVYLETSIAILLAGRCSEELFLGEVTTGVSEDLEQVSALARRMVCEWGMSEALGPLSLGDTEESIFLGREVTRQRRHGKATGWKIDQEIRKIVQEGYQRATRILQSHSKTLVRIAETLLEEETLDAGRLLAVVQAEEGPLGLRSHA
jgi:cell division protease FtsH